MIKGSEKGFSLVESLLVIVVIGSIVFLLANIPNALILINRSRHASLAREIVTKQIEDKRNVNFENLVNDNLAISDYRLNMLPQASGTVKVEDCSEAICSEGENIKQVTVTISWIDNNKPQTITLHTMIGEGGINQ